MIGIRFESANEKDRGKNTYVFDLIFSILGMPYEILNDGRDIDLQKHRTVINYGPIKPPLSLMEYVREGGMLINIPCYLEIPTSNKENVYQTRDTSRPEKLRWSRIKVRFPMGSCGSPGDIPFLYPFVSFDPEGGSGLGFYDGVDDGCAILSCNVGKGSMVLMGADLISTAFELITRAEERSGERDDHGRFRCQDSLAWEGGVLGLPVINIYVALLMQLISRSYGAMRLPLVHKCFFPAGKEVAAILTHDVDWTSTWQSKAHVFLALGRNVLRRAANREFRLMCQEALKLSSFLFTKRYPFWNIDELIELERRRNVRSTFYFLAYRNGESRDPVQYRYDITEPRMARAVQRITASGWNVGLHGSYDSWLNAEQLRTEKKGLAQVIGAEVSGIRQHYLRLSIPESWISQEEAGFLYDCTLGYADEPGFRAGMGAAFHPFDLQRQRSMTIWELPLTVMDATLLSRDEKGLSAPEAYQVIRLLIDTARRYNAVFGLLWHGDALDVQSQSVPLYGKILDYLVESQAFIASAEEFLTWWNARLSLRFVGTKRSPVGTEWQLQAGADIQDLSLRVIGGYGRKAQEVFVRGGEGVGITLQGPVTEIRFGRIPANDLITVSVPAAD